MEKIDVFKPRLPIINDAIKAHDEGKYSLSVPVLLAQIEGILWAYAEKQGVHYEEVITTEEGATKYLGSVELLLKKTKMKDQVSKLVIREYLNRIYVKKFRHGILHGRLIDYNTEKNSMKLLFFLRALMEECR